VAAVTAADPASAIASEPALAGAALALGAREVPGLVPQEAELLRTAPSLPRAAVVALRAAVGAGDDPLGRAFCALRDPARRRPDGAVYTPGAIVEAMVSWVAAGPAPARVVDPGAGSGRFAVAAGRRLPRASLVAVETDPLAALACRAHLATAGLAGRSRVVVADYRTAELGAARGPTAFIGNPPYVRHHRIAPEWKEWLAATAGAEGLRASGLAGLHVHFLLATAARARPGDRGALLTSSEWLDTGYGGLIRALLVGRLGGEAVHLLDPAAMPFADATVTAAITCFAAGSPPRAIRLRRVRTAAELGSLGAGGRAVPAARLRAARRWGPLTRPARRVPEGHVALGEICRVHRGAATGANATWVVRPDATDLPPAVLVPTVTRAREILEAGPSLGRTDHLRAVVDLPPDLDVLDLDGADRRRVERFLVRARRAGAHAGYLASARRAWWSVGLRPPAPILATYMARRPPAFTRNPAGARHLNVAHGLYPRVPLSDRALDRLAAALRDSADPGAGRVYAGGLVKLEPGDMERLPVPSPEALAA
jgi:hypothetical protein